MDQDTANGSCSALRSCSKHLCDACDSVRDSITLHPSQLHTAAPYLANLTSLTAVNISSVSTPEVFLPRSLQPLIKSVPRMASLVLKSEGDSSMALEKVDKMLHPWQHSLRHLELNSVKLISCIFLDSHVPATSWSPDLPGLTSLVITKQQMLFSVSLERCPELRELELIDNSVLTDVDLSRTKKLCWVVSSGGMLADLDLSGCANLDTLRCTSSNMLTSLDLRGCHSLRVLECSQTLHLVSLGLADCAALEEVCLWGNLQLEALDFTCCCKLRNVECYYNQKLACLHLRNKLELKVVTCSAHANLNSIDLSGCSALGEFSCCRNVALEQVELVGLPVLSYVACRGNRFLISLAITKCPAFSSLWCADNHSLSILDLSGCGALRTLMCTNNHRMSILNLASCSRLESLDISGSEALWDVDITACTELINLTGHDSNRVMHAAGLDVKNLHCCGCFFVQVNTTFLS